MRLYGCSRPILLALLLGLGATDTARAQIYLNAPNVVVRPPKLEGPDVKASPELWPRLDRGAALCRSEADLVRLAAARRGEAVDRPNCEIVRGPMAIAIVKRAGPGRTQVAVTERNGQEGWTDAWLPEKPPAAGGRPTSIR